MEPDVTSGDYLHGFLLGTREALSEKGRGSITITVEDVSARSLGALIALFERTVGLYALLVGVNAYHQPGVEAGKKAAAAVLDVQRALLAAMRTENGSSGRPRSGRRRRAPRPRPSGKCWSTSRRIPTTA